MNIPQQMTVRQKHSLIEIRQQYTIFNVLNPDKKVIPIARVVNSTFFLYRLAHIIISNAWLGFSYTVFNTKNQIIGTLQKPVGPTNTFSILDKDNLKIATTSVSKFSSDFTVESKTGWKVLVTRTGNDYIITFPKSLSTLIVTRKRRNILLNVFFPHIEYTYDFRGLPKSLQNDETFYIFISCLPIAMKTLNQ